MDHPPRLHTDLLEHVSSSSWQLSSLALRFFVCVSSMTSHSDLCRVGASRNRSGFLSSAFPMAKRTRAGTRSGDLKARQAMSIGVAMNNPKMRSCMALTGAFKGSGGNNATWQSGSFAASPSTTRLHNPRSNKVRLGSATAADSELHQVLELASDNELCELSDILYGNSLFSPIFKSLTPGDGSSVDSIFGNMDHEEEPRDELIDRLEARLLFLAADAKSTVSGRRPKYRDVLLQVRNKLQIRCSLQLSTEELESEIFLSLLQDFERAAATGGGGNGIAGLKLGLHDLMAAVFKGGSALTLSTLQRLVKNEISGRMLIETARYRVAGEALRKGGQLVANRMESHLAMLTSRQVIAGAARRYIAIRSAMVVLGPVLWGSFFADVALTALGTDYARVVRAIYALAQIRLTRTYNVQGRKRASEIFASSSTSL